MVNLRVRVAALETKVSPAGSLLIDGLRMERAQALDHFQGERCGFRLPSAAPPWLVVATCTAGGSTDNEGTDMGVLQRRIAKLETAEGVRRERFIVVECRRAALSDTLARYGVERRPNDLIAFIDDGDDLPVWVSVDGKKIGELEGAST
jgi:hypothetical protein